MRQFTTTQDAAPAPALRRLVSALAACSVLAGAGTAQAAISFSFEFSDAPNTGFFDPSFGVARQAAAQNAASMFSTMFGQFFSNSGNIVLDARSSFAPASGTLASAGSELQLATVAPGFNVSEVVKTKLLTGFDLNGSAADGFMNINFGQNWQLDPLATVGGSQFDFYGVVMHEFTHALGFASLVEQNGASLFGSNNWGTFDQFLANSSGNALIDGTSFAMNVGAWNAASVGGTSPAGGLFFNGPNAMAAAGGLVGLYSPTTWQDGSSGSHLDTNNPTYAGMMMNHVVSPGLAARSYSGLEVAIMTDLGYAALPIPEPATFALLLAGIGLVGTAARRKRL